MFEKLAIAGTVAIGLAIGTLWPLRQHSDRAGAEVVIPRSSDHHYYADADVNGLPVRFMIDTGASETALTESAARQIGLAVDPTKYEVIGDGASGMVRGQYVALKSIDLSGIRQHDLKAVIVPGATVSLLGQPFLESIDEITISKGEMRLTKESGS
jgi:aspartyl protease family protein